jgi:(p)ppGpp synthase/HD superfamily hydrolase
MMHQVAEHGMASHWAYTDSKRIKNGSDGGVDLYKTPWLSSIKEWQNDRISSRDFVDSVRRELLGKRVFVFLRNGKILNLARGATVIDASFQIHTEIGLAMHGALVNGKPVPLSYELCNGDVISILTGEGKPATDWMRYAKSRSTRSKLRAYFRARQKESLLEAGKILIMDYLWMHRSLIEEESLMEEEFAVPTLNVKDLERFLSKTAFEDLDDMLIELGKNHDRNLLHKFVSQMFEVPRKLLMEAEAKRNHLYDAGTGVDANDTITRRPHSDDARDDSACTAADNRGDDSYETSRKPSYLYTLDKLLARIEAPTEYADPEHLCKVCLPVHGDTIVGTRRTNNNRDATIPTVHRLGCPHAQEVINRAWASHRLAPYPQLASSLTSGLIENARRRVDSFTLRQQNWIYKGTRESRALETPVKLEWSDLDENNTLFLSEVVVVAEDRRLLLADCSAVVSETVEIVKSVSSSSEEHATLVFLVQATGLDHIQKLMDRLRRIRSVMSVERRFGSELLP